MAATNQIRQNCIIDGRRSAQGRRNELGHYAIPICYEDSLTTRRQADVFAQLVLQHFQTDCAHYVKVASGSF
jgi:hypothetical protein